MAARTDVGGVLVVHAPMGGCDEATIAAVGDVLRRNNALGFNTYGEQFCGVHVNQTLTAVALGYGDRSHGRDGDQGGGGD